MRRLERGDSLSNAPINFEDEAVRGKGARESGHGRAPRPLGWCDSGMASARNQGYDEEVRRAIMQRRSNIRARNAGRRFLHEKSECGDGAASTDRRYCRRFALDLANVKARPYRRRICFKVETTNMKQNTFWPDCDHITNHTTISGIRCPARGSAPRAR